MSHHVGRAMLDVCAAVGRLFSLAVIALIMLSPGMAHGQALPAALTGSNIGNATPAGRATFAGDTFTVEGGGTRVYSTSDQFFYVHRRMTGNGTIVARVRSVENTNSWAKAGVMIRESLAANSRHAFALVTPGRGIAFHRRTSTGGSTTHTGVSGVAPVWLRLVRSGSTFTASRSTNGTNWTTIRSVTISMASTVYVGLAVSSYNAWAVATGTFSNVSVTGWSPLPSGWTAADVGAPALAGSTKWTGTGFAVTGAGADIWGTSDQFRYVYRQVTGDVDVIARVDSFQGPTGWSKAGVMVRASLTGGSAHASMFVTPAKGLAFQRRPATRMSSLSTSGGSGAAPVWVKLERRGSAVTAFRSSTGTSWTMIGSETLTLPTTFYVGLAVTSHSTSARATARFTNVTVGSSSTSTATPPTVSLTSPAAGATYLAPASVTISASAADTDGTIKRVDFYAGSTLVGSDTTSPYSVTWSSAPPGSYALTAVARDNLGASTASAARSITIAGATMPRRAIFEPSTDHATVIRYVLDVFAAGANPATATPVATQSVGKPAVVNGECTADIAATISRLPGGSYFATVVAVSSAGTSARATSAVFVR